MQSWADYSFSPNMKIQVKETGQVGFLSRDNVIDFWMSPLIKGTPACFWCDWQLKLIDCPAFDRDFRSCLLTAMKSGKHRLRDLMELFLWFGTAIKNLQKPNPNDDFQRREGHSMILFRFYTGHHHGLLPRVLVPKYPSGKPIDPLMLLTETKPVTKTKMKSLMPFETDMRVMGTKVTSTTHGSSAHGQGFTEGSSDVSMGPSLPNLMVSDSFKLRIIIFSTTNLFG